MLVYKLNQNIDGAKLLNDIQKLVTKHSGSDKELLLIIKTQEISYIDDSNIPKIEYKNLDEQI